MTALDPIDARCCRFVARHGALAPCRTQLRDPVLEPVTLHLRPGCIVELADERDALVDHDLERLSALLQRRLHMRVLELMRIATPLRRLGYCFELLGETSELCGEPVRTLLQILDPRSARC